MTERQMDVLALIIVSVVITAVALIPILFYLYG